MREVILNVNVFGPIMKFGIFGYTNTWPNTTIKSVK
jgi:hypothetical protein